MNDLELKNRTRWAINRIASESSLTNITLSSLMGFAATTVSNYRTTKHSPKTSFIIKFCQLFKYNQNWFMTGEGEPFPGARSKYPEVCGPERSVFEERDPGTSYDALITDQKIKVEEAMGKAYKILSSGTAVAAALYLNIQQFAAVLDSSQELKACRDEISELKGKIKELKQ